VQEPEESGWFPGVSCAGRPGVLAARFPGAGLWAEDVAAYVVQRPEHGDDDREWDSPARPGDEFSRGDQCAVVDFLRMLGVGIELRDRGTGTRYVTPLADPSRAFTVLAPE
jgi:hypothetical protein